MASGFFTLSPIKARCVETGKPKVAEFEQKCNPGAMVCSVLRDAVLLVLFAVEQQSRNTLVGNAMSIRRKSAATI